MDKALVWELKRKAERPSGLEGIAGPYMEVDNAALIEETVKHVCQFLTDIGQDYIREQGGGEAVWNVKYPVRTLASAEIARNSDRICDLHLITSPTSAKC